MKKSKKKRKFTNIKRKSYSKKGGAIPLPKNLNNNRPFPVPNPWNFRKLNNDFVNIVSNIVSNNGRTLDNEYIEDKHNKQNILVFTEEGFSDQDDDWDWDVSKSDGGGLYLILPPQLTLSQILDGMTEGEIVMIPCNLIPIFNPNNILFVRYVNLEQNVQIIEFSLDDGGIIDLNPPFQSIFLNTSELLEEPPHIVSSSRCKNEAGRIGKIF